MHSRRSLLKAGLSAGTGASLLGALPGLGAAAAQTGGGYKALVCILLNGGMDGHDTLIPTTPGAYGAMADARRTLMDDYEALGDDGRTMAALHGLDSNGAASGVGLPRDLAPLAALYRSGHLSVVANVGPLAERTTRSKVRGGGAVLPPRLQSHNDQKSLWATFAEDSLGRHGWGGLMAERTGAPASPFASMTFTRATAFGARSRGGAYLLGTGRVQRPPRNFSRTGFGGQDPLGEHFRASAARMDSLLATDFQNAQREAADASQALFDGLDGRTDGDAVRLSDNKLSEQLAVVAKVIAARDALGASRQVFLVELGGFDTHDGQAARLPVLQAKLADAMAAFYQETVRQGVAGDVLTFTASEFGRSLVPNKDGTDHGWGGHHFVMGGGTTGGRIHGELPEAGLEHDLDLDRGRLIPTTAVDQYAGGVGRWFGVPESALSDIIPNHGRLGPALSF